MMKACQEYIQKLIANLPDECTVKDLIAAGIYPSRQAAYFGRSRNSGPPYVLLGGRVVYPKQSVIEWLNTRNSHVQEDSIGSQIHAKAKEKTITRIFQKGLV